MAYATVSVFDVDLDTHRKIVEEIGDAPIKGLIVHAAGTAEGGVDSIDVWENKADHDRFFVEHLMPAMQRLGIEGGPPASFREFDLPVVVTG